MINARKKLIKVALPPEAISAMPKSCRLRFIEVKGRHSEGRTITVTKNDIVTALNRPDDFILAIVQVDGDRADMPRYIRRPFTKEPDFGVTSVNYDIGEQSQHACADTHRDT